MGSRWACDLFLSKVTKRLLLKSLLDASPLAQTLMMHIHFWKISRAIRAGAVDGLAVSATNYHDGSTNIFYDSHDNISPWKREKRRAIRTAIRVRHIMASCSIPLLFEPVRIGDYLYGDGSLRFSFPISPAIHLGATHIFAVGIRCPTPENALGFRPEIVGLGFVAGAVMNSIFLDSLEADYENLTRISKLSPNPILHCLVRPSLVLGAMAKDHLYEVPFHFRQLLRSTANPQELGDLLSYLMFSRGYLTSLLELGRADAANYHGQIEKFLATPAFPQDMILSGSI
jgi:NTE family protein